MAKKTHERGFAAMVEEDPGRQKQIASAGGKASGGKFEKGSRRASAAGRKGAQNQPAEAKALGGEH